MSNATSTKLNRFSRTLHVSPIVIADRRLACQPCCRSCHWIHSNNDELAAGSWCCTESEMVSLPYPLQLTLNQFPSAPEGSKQDVCRFSAIQAHTVRPMQVQSGCGTLPVGICQLPGNSSKTHLCSFHFIWAPDDFLFLLSALHCFYPKLQFIVCCMASSIHIGLLMVWYCSKSSCTVIRTWRWIVAKLLKWRQDLMTILTLCALHALYTLLVYLSMTVIVCPSLLKSQINCNLCL